MQHKIVYIDSDSKSSGTHEDFEYDVGNIDYDYVSLLSVSIPKSFYNVQDQLNTISLMEGAAVVQIPVTPGNYSFRNLATTLVTLLNAASPTNQTYQVAADTMTGRYKITSSTIDFSIIFDEKSYLYKHMGFDTNTTNESIGRILISKNVCSFMDVPSIYIISDIVETYKNTLADQVLEAVFVGNVPDFSNVTWTNPDPKATMKKVKKGYNRYRFRLFDGDRNPIKLNGVSMNMVLGFYNEDRIFNLLNDFTRYIVDRDLAQASLEDGSATQKDTGK